MKKNYLIFFFFLLSFSHTQAQYITTIAGRGSCVDSGDGGLAIKAQLGGPTGLCRDKAGNIYVGDVGSGGGTPVRRISVTDTIITIAGGGPLSATADGIPATTAYLYKPYGVCIDTEGNLLIADEKRIRKVNLVTGIITTVAGTLTAGFSGDGGPAIAAELSGPVDVATDTANNIYIADLGNSIIRKVNAVTGIISTIAGYYLSSSYAGDGGPATAARLNKPFGVYVDKNGNVYIADTQNDRVRKISAATGIITTIAGTGTAGDSGDGTPATAAGLYQPFRVTMDKPGNIYISEFGIVGKGNIIRKIDAATGIITTFAGNGTGGGFLDTMGNGGPATSAAMDPFGMCFDTCGNMFVADGCLIRVITPAPLVDGRLCNDPALGAPAPMAATGIQLYPNPNNGLFTIKIASNATALAHIIITDVLGQKIKEIAAMTNESKAIQLNAPPGIYFVNVVTARERWSERVVISP